MVVVVGGGWWAFSRENTLQISTRVAIAPGILLSHNEPTAAPVYSIAERERQITSLPSNGTDAVFVKPFFLPDMVGLLQRRGLLPIEQEYLLV